MADPEHAENVKHRIFDAAHECFARRGFDVTRMEDIAQKAGLAKGTLYLYFRSKDELFKSMMETRMQFLVNKYNQLLKANEEDFIEANVALFEESSRMSSSYAKLMIEAMAEATRDPRVYAVMQKKTQTICGFIAPIVRDAQRRGYLPRTADPESLDVGMHALWFGLRASRFLGIQEDEIVKAGAQMIRLLYRKQ
jgi:AcrR family transcriptional regulator